MFSVNFAILLISQHRIKLDNQTRSLDLLINYFKSFFPLNEEELRALSLVFRERKIKRRGLILQQGEVCRDYTFVVSGCFKMYAVDNSGKEHNLRFSAENDWIADIASFHSKKESAMFIEAVEPSVILQIKHADLLDLYIRYHKFDRNFRIITEQKYIELQNRIFESISATAEERYLSFLEQYQKLSGRLPNTQIASYLGITPEFLSKIRNDLAHRA